LAVNGSQPHQTPHFAFSPPKPLFSSFCKISFHFIQLGLQGPFLEKKDLLSSQKWKIQ
jgi:hypothetical protein